jgi:rod shape-determining protein MreD
VALIHSGTHRILLPVRVSFMALSVVLALLFNLLPWGDTIGVPDMLALVLVFWCIHQPRRMGIGISWTIGLLMDAGSGALMGQHALAYAVLAFLATALHRRILWFPPWQQAAHIVPLLLLSPVLMLSVRMFAGAPFPGFGYFLGSLVAGALWPVATFLLLAPQRRPEAFDENRPI